MTEQMNTSRNARDASAIEGAPQGARRATEEAPSIARSSSSPAPNPEVPAVAQRRRFSGRRVSMRLRHLLGEFSVQSLMGLSGRPPFSVG